MTDMSLVEAVETRRSVRIFEKESIPDDVVHHCLDMALLAPNSSNLQPWEFYRIKEPKLREELDKAFMSQPAARTAAELIICVARLGSWRSNRARMLEQLKKQDPPAPASALAYYEKLVPFAYTVGPFGVFGPLKRLIFWARGLFMPTPREPTGAADLKLWAVKTCALACQNLMLAFRSHGYDSCPMEGYDSARVRRLLKLPCDAVIVMGIGAGKRSPKGVYGPRVRFDRALFVKEI